MIGQNEFEAMIEADRLLVADEFVATNPCWGADILSTGEWAPGATENILATTAMVLDEGEEVEGALWIEFEPYSSAVMTWGLLVDGERLDYTLGEELVSL